MYRSLTLADVQPPRQMSGIGNPIWATVNAPTNPTANVTPYKLQFELRRLPVPGDQIILNGAVFRASLNPQRPSDYQIPAPSLNANADAARNIVRAITTYFGFKDRYAVYAKTNVFVTTVYITAPIPGALLNLAYAFVSGSTTPNDDPFQNVNETLGVGVNIGQDLPGYGALLEVWGQNTWVYGDGNSDFTPVLDSRLLAPLSENAQASGQHEFNVANLVASTHTDTRPALAIYPYPYPGASALLGRMNAVKPYFLRAGQVRQVNSFRQRSADEAIVAPLFSWNGAIPVPNPSDLQHRLTTGFGLKGQTASAPTEPYKQHVLSSLFNPVARPATYDVNESIHVIQRSQPIAYLSFLHTRVDALAGDFREGMQLFATYYFRLPNGTAGVIKDKAVYGDVPGSAPYRPEADIYHARIDWGRTKGWYEQLLAVAFPNDPKPTTEDRYPLDQVDYYFGGYSGATNQIQALTFPAKVTYRSLDCQSALRTLVFRNAWGAFEAVELRAGETTAFDRSIREYARGLKRSTSQNAYYDDYVVDSLDETLTVSTKTLTPLEAAWLRELAGSDRVYLYVNQTNYDDGGSGEQLVPMVVKDAKMAYDTDGQAIMTLQVRLSKQQPVLRAAS